MNRKMIFHIVGRIAVIEALLLLPPLIVSIIERDGCSLSFLITIGVSLAVGVPLSVFCRSKDKTIFAREGFVTVAFSWIVLSLIGALPFFISREIPHYADAFFETVSGFTTTGASILTDVERMSKSMLFWRSFTHWVGGMGVLVFIMAIFPTDSGRSMHVMRAEMPGPIVGKLVPRIRETARILYLLYIALTILQIGFLCIGGMGLFDSIVHAFGTAGTGGFGVKADSIGGYSPYLQWVITIFMVIFGINFNLYYLIFVGRMKNALKSGELWCYLSIILLSTGLITLNIIDRFDSFGGALRASAFQVSSIITTTGYSTVDFNLWPGFSKTILLLLMFIGGCAGSTAGGLKVSRLILIVKMIRRNLRKLLRPRSVGVIKLEGKTVDDATLNSATLYLSLYLILFAGIVLLLSLEPFDFETTFSAAAACFNNVGPGFGAVGPAASYADYSAASKVLLSFSMLLGRLEIYPLLLMLSPSNWIKKNHSLS